MEARECHYNQTFTVNQFYYGCARHGNSENLKMVLNNGAVALS